MRLHKKCIAVYIFSKILFLTLAGDISYLKAKSETSGLCKSFNLLIFKHFTLQESEDIVLHWATSVKMMLGMFTRLCNFELQLYTLICYIPSKSTWNGICWKNPSFFLKSMSRDTRDTRSGMGIGTIRDHSQQHSSYMLEPSHDSSPTSWLSPIFNSIASWLPLNSHLIKLEIEWGIHFNIYNL